MTKGRKRGKGRGTEGVTMIVKTMIVTSLLSYNVSKGSMKRESPKGKSRHNQRYRVTGNCGNMKHVVLFRMLHPEARVEYRAKGTGKRHGTRGKRCHRFQIFVE
jgi:hypothetical protein